VKTARRFPISNRRGSRSKSVARDAAATTLALLALFFTAGCKRELNVTVTGRVLKNGQPLALGPTGNVQITLVPDLPPDEHYTSRIGECDKDGNFTITNVKPGRYKIGVEQFDPNPQTDKLNGAFTAAGGKIIREVDGKEPVVIELTKPGT
jgi:hypothetical protein